MNVSLTSQTSRFLSEFVVNRGVEQLVARRAHNPKVVSSSLAPATQKSNQKWLLFFGLRHSSQHFAGLFLLGQIQCGRETTLVRLPRRV
jgi:hypothetical protein